MDSEVRMQYSDDGEANWSNWSARSLGDVGEYHTRIVWTQMGQALNRVYVFESSSPKRRDMFALVGHLK